MKPEDVLLTDKEKKGLEKALLDILFKQSQRRYSPYPPETVDLLFALVVLHRKDQLKKVVEWGVQPCTEHKHYRYIALITLRFECRECMEELRKLAGLGE